MKVQEVRDVWVGKALLALKGKRVVSVRYMEKEEMEMFGWFHNPIVIQLDDGTLIWPQRDDEGNDGGALGVFSKDKSIEPLIPVT